MQLVSHCFSRASRLRKLNSRRPSYIVLSVTGRFPYPPGGTTECIPPGVSTTKNGGKNVKKKSATRNKSQDRRAKASELTRRILAGDRTAEDEAYRRYYKKLARIIRRYTNCKDDLDDAMSILWLIALPKLRRGELVNPEALGDYLGAIARNVALGELRKCPWLVFSGEHLHVEGIIDSDTPEDVIQRRQSVARALELVSQAPVKRDRDVIEACCVNDQDAQDICSEYGLTKVQLSRILSRARKRLRVRATQSGDATMTL